MAPGEGLAIRRRAARLEQVTADSKVAAEALDACGWRTRPFAVCLRARSPW